jgi:hypothetical protein
VDLLALFGRYFFDGRGNRFTHERTSALLGDSVILGFLFFVYKKMQQRVFSFFRSPWAAFGVDAKHILPYAAPMGKTKKTKLSKSDPEFYSKIAKIAGQKLVRLRGTNYFSKLAKKSHPRAEYHGGRPKKAA